MGVPVPFLYATSNSVAVPSKQISEEVGSFVKEGASFTFNSEIVLVTLQSDSD